MQWLWKILDIILGINSIIEKTLPDAEMQKEIYHDKKPFKDGQQMEKILRQAKRYLLFHPKERKRREDIDNYVQLKHDALDEDDRQELKKQLYLAFPKSKV